MGKKRSLPAQLAAAPAPSTAAVATTASTTTTTTTSQTASSSSSSVVPTRTYAAALRGRPPPTPTPSSLPPRPPPTAPPTASPAPSPAQAQVFPPASVYAAAAPEEDTPPTDSDRKKAARSDATASAADAMASASSAEDPDEMGEFEDAWMDEEDDDEGEVIIDKGSDDEDEDEDMDMDGIDNGAGNGKGKGKATNIGASNDDDDDVDDANVNVYLPGQQLAEGEVLVPDNTVYEMLHQLHVEWPCLSFDFLKDNLGINRKTFPMTSYMVAGSQADRAVENKIYVMKASELQKTKQDEMDDESDDEAFDDDPVLEHRTIPHSGSVNRIRAMPHHESLQIVSTWSENGRVYIWDLTQVVAAIDTPGVVPSKESLKPIFTVDKHGRNEGFAMDWSGANQKYRLLTGDIAHNIFLTVQSQATFVSEAQPFKGHESSVEDIQWSPSEDTVFASCSADKTIRIWDTRTKKKPQISWVAHDSDVNVISWNRLTDNLLASGSDSGAFSVWDLRGVAQSSATNPPVPAATFNWHRGAITSIEWHPFESSMLAAAGSDDQLTIWDLALERDPEEEAVMAGGGAGGAAVEVPPQLLFVHQGQQDLKELHWHKQMPGVLASTALSGFSIFKTINS